MDKRESLVDQFSTFIVWREDRFSQWQVNPRLRHHMQQHCQQNDSVSSQYWVAYWHQQWQRHTFPFSSISREHLYSYLQDPCYRVAAQLWANYRNRKDQPLTDLFSQGVLCFEKLLENFNPVLNPNLAAYASFFLKWRILDELRRQDKSYGHTLWSLLIHSSEARVRKALIAMGLTDTVLACHLQAWECYVELYKPVKIKREGKIQAPPAEIWSQIAAVYTAVMSEDPGVDRIKQWVETCGQAVFRYIAPSEVSLNQPLSADGQQELLDVIPVPETDVSAADSSDDYKTIHNQILTWLRAEWQTLEVKKYRLNANVRTIVQLYYGEGREQTEISRQLEINQSTVSRTLNKVKAILAERFLEWSANHLHISPLTDDIEIVNEAVSQWLWSICQTEPTGGQDG